MKKKLQLDVGKRYLRRDGWVAGPMENNRDQELPFWCPTHQESYRADGQYWLSGNRSDRDLVSEVDDTPLDMTASADSLLPEDDSERQQYVLMDYITQFPHAMLRKAKHSWVSNEKHNPGEPVHWAKDKSIGDGNQVMRHLLSAIWLYKQGRYDEALKDMDAAGWRMDELHERMITRMEPFTNAEARHAAKDSE